MQTTSVELPLDLTRHSGRVCAKPDAIGGWNVSVEVDGRQVATDYCADWRRVERVCERMQRWLRTAEEAEPKPARTM